MHRFAGRSLPLEKVALRKSKRYFAQDKKLTLPALEIIFIWNGFKMIQCQQDSVMSFLMICENKINELLQRKDQYENYYDDYSFGSSAQRCLSQVSRTRLSSFHVFSRDTSIVSPYHVDQE
ncbi:hypothetical protein AHF37_08943 [Paragonimus kellicotti]|nr:hypothetical protein AHF37_08943 [Paragonimus kellicotti]